MTMRGDPSELCPHGPPRVHKARALLRIRDLPDLPGEL